MNKAYGLAAVCGLCASALMAATPALSINDGVATISKSTALTEDDQSTLDGLQSVLVDSTFAGTSSAPVFYAAKGQTVTIPAVNFANGSTVYCGKMDSGTLRFASSIAHKSGQYLDLFGLATLCEGWSANAAFIFQTGSTGTGYEITVNKMSGTTAPDFQTRGNTVIRFAQDEVFATATDHLPAFTFGKASNPSGILELDGHSQTIGSLAAFIGKADTESWNTSLYINSDPAATLTVKNGFGTTKSEKDVYDGRLLGGVSFKLDGKSGVVASFSNTVVNAVTQYSTTTGELVCAGGTIKLLKDCRFTQLSALRKEGAGNFELSTAELGDKVVAYLDGTGKVTLNVDVSVQNAFVKNGDGEWEYLDAGEYTAANLPAHLSGEKTLYVLKGAPDDGKVKTYTWKGGTSDDLTVDANWEGGEAPDLSNGKSYLVFPATAGQDVKVSGAITVNGFSIASDGAFELKAAEDAVINVRSGGIALAGTSVTLDPAICFVESADIPCTVGDGTQVFFNGPLSSIAAPGTEAYAVSFDGDAEYTFACDNGDLLHRLYVTNATAVVACHSNAFGRTALELVNERQVVYPTFDGLTGITAAIALDMPFEGSESDAVTWVPKAQTPFTFGGKVSLRGQLWTHQKTDKDEYDLASGYCVLTIPGNITFKDGFDLSSLRRLQFMIARDTTLRIEGDVSRVSCRSDYLVSSPDSSPTDVRFYPSSGGKIDWGMTAVAELACRFVVKEKTTNASNIFAPQVTLRLCRDDGILPTGYYMPYVNSRAQSRGLCMGAMDLNGHDLSLKGFDSTSVLENVGTGFVEYPDAYYSVTSEAPATLSFNLKNSEKNTYTVPYRFTGAAGLASGGDWASTLFMTNVHSTATGDVSVASGVIRFGGGAGWAGESTVSVSGTGTVQVDPGAWGFSGDRNGRKCRSKVTLAFPEENKGTLRLNGDCEVAALFVNGVELPTGTYTAATLAPYLAGPGTLTVCGKNLGTVLLVR